MSLHFEKELNRLRKQLLELCTITEESVNLAMEAIQREDRVLAAKVIERDGEIDRMEILVEEECLKILALHQPVAVDLRFIVAALKMNNDLERIGDLAAGIAKKYLRIANHKNFVSPVDFTAMSATTRKMLRESFDSLIYLDNVRACNVRETDSEVDDMKQSNKEKVLEAIKTSTENVEALIAVLGISRDLERIADLATNIAEDVSYLLEGDIVRHGHGHE